MHHRTVLLQILWIFKTCCSLHSFHTWTIYSFQSEMIKMLFSIWLGAVPICTANRHSVLAPALRASTNWLQLEQSAISKNHSSRRGTGHQEWCYSLLVTRETKVGLWSGCILWCDCWILLLLAVHVGIARDEVELKSAHKYLRVVHKYLWCKAGMANLIQHLPKLK